MIIPKAPYPKTITGTLTFSADTTLDIPEIQVSYVIALNSKGNRKIQSVTARYPSRYTQKTVSKTLDKDDIYLEYGPDDKLYSVLFNSTDCLIDPKTGMPLESSEIEAYIASERDMDLVILVQIAFQLFGTLEDTIPQIDICSAFLCNTIQSMDDNDEEDLPDL